MSGTYNCNPAVNLQLLGVFGVTASWPVHGRWFNNDHGRDSAQWEQHSANEVPWVCSLNCHFSLTDTFVAYVSYRKLFLWKQFSLFPTLNGQLDFYSPNLTIIIVTIMYIIDRKLGFRPCDLYTLLIHCLQMRKETK